MNGRLQACRMYELTDDPGVRDMLHFMIARDHMHQLQWLSVIEEFGGMHAALPTPATFPLSEEMGKYAYAFMAYAQDVGSSKAGEGRWAQGPAPDGKGTSNYIKEPFAAGEAPHLPVAPDSVFDAPPKANGASAIMEGGAKTSGSKNVTVEEDRSPSLMKRVGNALTGDNS